MSESESTNPVDEKSGPDESDNGADLNGATPMSFLDHLAELRDRIIRMLISVMLTMLVAFVFSNDIIKFLLYPPIIIPGVEPPIKLMKPVITQVQGLMMVKIQVGLIAGIVLSLPVILIQLWRFISPGLKKREKRFAIPIIVSATGFFILGATFAYLIVIPITLNFLLTMGNIDNDLGIVVQNMIDLESYLGFVSGFMLISGLTFELPVIAFFLTKIGILTPKFMRHYWRHAVVACLIVSAVVTPTTDMITMMVVALPMILLYEVSIWVSKITLKKEKQHD
jgi:sec-independent protein translocase protein TatC